MPKPVHPPPPPQPRDHKKPRHDSPPTSPSRRRAPALERLPRWLFAPVRHFVSARAELPLPKRVAVGGKPFYDWDAWALSLLTPSLWKRRGPWQRLVGGCTAWKPPLVDDLETVKSALVRIVVAEVVSLLVNRSGDQLTPEDRNWITSVASRQRSRDQRKPTLMLLFDLAFPLFDMALHCRCRQRSSDCPPLDQLEAFDGEVQRHLVRIAMESSDSTSTVADDTDSEKGSKHDDKPSFSETSKEIDTRNMDPFILKAMQLISPIAPMRRSLSDASTIETVRLVVNALEALLQSTKAPRWYVSYPSTSQMRTQSLKRVAITFVDRLPLPSIPSDKLGRGQQLTQWLRSAFLPEQWKYWAELANDFAYMNLSSSDRDNRARNDICNLIIDYLLMGDKIPPLSDDGNDVTAKSGGQNETKSLTISDFPEQGVVLRRILDIAINLEQIFALFVESHGNDNTTASDVTWLVGLFERIIQDLSASRDFLLVGSSSREMAMGGWSAHALDVSMYYRQAIHGRNATGEDIDRAIHSAFSEASWSQHTRNMRFMVQQPCFYSPNTRMEKTRSSETAYQFWVATLDLRDPVYQAVAIVPWDPQRALRLLDEAIGLTPQVMAEVLEGRKGLPLWDYRRVGVYRMVLCRGNFPQAVLIMERLQRLFDQKSLHDGGAFSEGTIPLLEAAAKEGNICAQTTHGLLLAGEGTYWDVARSWACCEKSKRQGVQKLYASAMAGDLEASTALSHVWAQDGSKDAEVFKDVPLEQIFALFKIAVTSQNAQAVMNMGVMWRYGVSCLKPDHSISMDAFLMALQGTLLPEARSLAAKHLLEALNKPEGEVSKVLQRLAAGTAPECLSLSGPEGLRGTER